VHLERDEMDAALDYFERANSVYMEAMGTGGEAEGWREALIAEALLGVGRTAEALERGERGATVARDRSLGWSLSRALRVLARARLAAGAGGAEEALEEAETVASRNGQAVELEEIRALKESVAARQA
jgi:hypothetical protein